MGMEGRQHYDYDTALHQLVTVALVTGISLSDYNVPPKAMSELNCVDCLLYSLKMCAMAKWWPSFYHK